MTIDGAGPVRKFFGLYLPLVRPALATAAIFTFLGAWDEFVWALTVIDDPEKRTLPIAIPRSRASTPPSGDWSSPRP